MSFGPITKPLELSGAPATDMEVGGAATFYTKSFPLAYASDFAIAYKASKSAGAIDLKIELQQAYRKPEASEEGQAAATLFAEPDGMSDIETSLTDEVLHMKALSPIVMPWGRFKITGGAGNDASAKLKMWLGIKEQL